MNFDDIIKSKLESLESPANANAWTEFETKLNASQTHVPFKAPLIGGIAATIALTVLFTSLPDIKANKLETPVEEQEDIELFADPIKESESDFSMIEHSPQEEHIIKLNIIDEEIALTVLSGSDAANNSGSLIEKKAENNSIENDFDNESFANISNRIENINFSANGIQCPSSEITFTAELEKAADVTWIFDGVTVKSGLQVTHIFEDAGEYIASMIVKFNDGFEQSLTQSIEVYSNPKAEFEIINNTSDLCLDPTLEFAGTPGSNTYKWVLDGDTVAKGAKASAVVSKDLHTVGMHTINEWGCTSYESRSIKVESGLELQIPTAFSPTRADGLNDTWMPVGLDKLNSFHIEIRRVSSNQVVFETSEMITWDGSLRGSSEPIAIGEVFTYLITATDQCGKTKQYTNIIRYL